MRRRCLNRKPFVEKHGMARTPIYKTWCSMIERCYTDTHQAFQHYGGRGIEVCERWRHGFDNFYADMGDRPEGLSLDRIDNNKGYTPDNCRWATSEEQMANTRMARLLEYKGEKLPVAAWARKLGVSRNRINTRLQRGMTVEEALTVPKLSQWDKKYGKRKPDLKTHCKWGHEFTAENTGRQGKGARRCLTCHRMGTKKFEAMKKAYLKENASP